MLEFHQEVPPRRQPTPGPPVTADRPEAATERDGREEACTVLELLNEYHEREWSLSTDHEAMDKGGADRFILTMGAIEAEGGDESGREGEGVRELYSRAVSPCCRHHCFQMLSVCIGRHAPALLAPPPCATGTR